MSSRRKKARAKPSPARRPSSPTAKPASRVSNPRVAAAAAAGAAASAAAMSPKKRAPKIPATPRPKVQSPAPAVAAAESSQPSPSTFAPPLEASHPEPSAPVVAVQRPPRRWSRLDWVSVFVALALVAAFVAVYFSHTSSTNSLVIPQGLQPAVGVAQQVGDSRPLAPSSVLTPPATFPYSEDPPASGPHYDSSQGLAWGSLSTSTIPESYLSNLDRGGVVILYDCNPPSIGTPPSPCLSNLSSLQAFVTSSPKEARFQEIKLAAAYPLQGHRFLLLAWGWQLYLDQWDAAAALRFYKAHVDNGPSSRP